VIHDSTAIVAQQSGRCGADYGLLDVDYGQILRGERLVRSTDQLRWWIETAVLAHLLGRPSYGMSADLRGQLGRFPLGALKAAIAYGVDEATAARSAVIRPGISAGPLAEHVAAALWDSLFDQSATVCQAERQWIAAPFKAILDTVAHEARTSTTAAETLEELQWSWTKRHSAKNLHDIVLGQDQPSAIERVLETERDAPHWQRAVERAGDRGPIDPVVAGILANLPQAER
jgi:hypothetical protein